MSLSDKLQVLEDRVRELEREIEEHKINEVLLKKFLNDAIKVLEV